MRTPVRKCVEGCQGRRGLGTGVGRGQTGVDHRAVAIAISPSPFFLAVGPHLNVLVERYGF